MPLIPVLLALPALAQTRNNEIGAAIGYADMGDFGDAGTFGLSYNRYFGNLSLKFDLTGFSAELETVDVGPGGDPDSGAGDFEMGAFGAAVQYHSSVDRDSRRTPAEGSRS